MPSGTVTGAAATVTAMDLSSDSFGVSGEPRVSHTSSVFVIDDTGTVVLVWQFGIAAKDLEMDLRLLLGDRT